MKDCFRIAPPGGGAPEVAAVVDMGASSLRLLIAELPASASPRVLEGASKGSLLGKEAFTSGKLSPATMESALKVLAGFRSIMDGYGVTRYRAVATSAVREAENRDNFLDRVRLKTGLSFE